MMIEKAFGSDLRAESFLFVLFNQQDISIPTNLHADHMYTEITSHSEYDVYLCGGRTILLNWVE